MVSGFIALYATHQQIKANRHDNFNNAINFNNYKELNNLLNNAFKEINLVLKIDSSVTTLIKDSLYMGLNPKEYTITKYLSFYNKIFPQIINFCNSYNMKLKSITGNFLDMSKPVRDLNTFESVIKNKTNKGHNTIYNDINILFNLDKQIYSINSSNNTNATFNNFSPNNREYPHYDSSNLVKKQIRCLNDFKRKIKELLKILTRMTNDIQDIRDKNIRTLMKQ